MTKMGASNAIRKILLFCLTAMPLAISAQPSRQKTSVVHAGDVDLSYEVHGSSPGVPIIFANGGPGFPLQITSRAAAWSKLAAQRTLIFYDQRGLGSSRLLRPDAPQTLDAQVADLEALRRSLGAEKIIIAGHSWGGVIAMGYAAAYPEHVEKMILIDSARPNWNEESVNTLDAFFPDIRQQARNLEKQGDTPEIQDEAYRLHLAMLFYSDRNRRTFENQIKGIKLNYQVNEANVNAMKTVDLWPQLKALKIPTLILTGRFDANIPPSVAWKIHNAIAGSKFVVFSKSGHFPFVEEPGRFVSVIDEFIQMDLSQ
jgi:proline iminopeptidase